MHRRVHQPRRGQPLQLVLLTSYAGAAAAGLGRRRVPPQPTHTTTPCIGGVLLPPGGAL